LTTGNYDSDSCQIFHNVSVATWLNCRGIFIMTNLLISLIVKKISKSAGIWATVKGHSVAITFRLTTVDSSFLRYPAGILYNAT